MAGPQKLDLKKDLKALYTARSMAVVVDVPRLSFLMLDGAGDPNTSAEYAAAIGALYSVAYTLKFTIKKSPHPVDYAVMPLEGLWWARDMTAFTGASKDRWQWTTMILQPDLVTGELFETARAEAARKKPNHALALLRFESFAEGRSAQLMHLGPYAAETENIRKLHAFIAEQGGTLAGKHHEIYLSDPRRSAPEKLKTIIRQPFVT
ncbi:MAG: GyrI-like domain-containing protein [Devosia sp.]